MYVQRAEINLWLLVDGIISLLLQQCCSKQWSTCFKLPTNNEQLFNNCNSKTLTDKTKTYEYFVELMYNGPIIEEPPPHDSHTEPPDKKKTTLLIAKK